MSNTPALTEQHENLELTQEELASLEVDSGKSAAGEGVLETAELEEAATKPEARKRRKSFNTGHKLKILMELKSGLSPKEICKYHKITPTTLALIASDDSLQETVNSTYIEKTKKLMAARFYQLADMALSHIDPTKLERLDAYKLGMLAAIALDKARLIEGQPTENLSFLSLSRNIAGTLNELQMRKAKLETMLAGSTGIREAEVL